MPIQSVSLPQSALEHIRFQIITGQFAPGQKLNEEHLAAELDISRPPLRECFRLLESERLVTRIPRKGTYVSDVSVEDLDDLYQVRRMIESQVVEILKSKNIKDLPEVERTLGDPESESIFSPDDMKAIIHYANRSTNFHVKLVEATGSVRLVQFYRSIYSNITRYKIIFLFLGKFHNSEKDHQHFIKLIKAGTYKEAHTFLMNHVSKSYDFLRKTITNNSDKSWKEVL